MAGEGLLRICQRAAEAALPACKLAALDGDWRAAGAALQRAAAATERFPTSEPIAAAEASALELVWWRANQFPDTPGIDARTKPRLNALRDRFPDSKRIRQARANAHMALAEDTPVGRPIKFARKPEP